MDDSGLITLAHEQTPTPARQPEGLTDCDVETLSSELRRLPVAWFDLEPCLIVGDASLGEGGWRWAALQQTSGPKFSLQLGIWRTPEGYMVTHAPEESVWEEWPIVATVQEAVQSIGAFIAVMLEGWGLRIAHRAERARP